MQTAEWMVFAAAMLPYACAGITKLGAKGYDNANPRAFVPAQGWRLRADWAQRNHFEALPFFAAAVIIAEMSHAPQARIDLLAIVFVALRVAYTVLYLANLASLRSLVWMGGIGTAIALFLSAR